MNKLAITLLLLLAFSLQAELKELKLDSSLKVKIKTSPRCLFGDMNAMVLDINEYIQKKKAANIIMSLESYDGTVAKKATLLSSRKGVEQLPSEVYFDVSDIQSQKLLGIFICLDSKGNGNCLNKKAQDIKTTIARHQVDGNKQGKVDFKDTKVSNLNNLPEDKLYFFQPVIFVDGTLRFYDENLPLNGNSKLNKDFKGLSSSSVIGDIWSKINAVKSLPLALEDGTLALDLPRYSKAKCS